jgi:hypothetical protein
MIKHPIINEIMNKDETVNGKQISSGMDEFIRNNKNNNYLEELSSSII